MYILSTKNYAQSVVKNVSYPVDKIITAVVGNYVLLVVALYIKASGAF